MEISLDLETWGTYPGCQVRSIGACLFDRKGGVFRPEIGEVGLDEPTNPYFYVAIETPDDDPYGLTKSESTVAWWANQNEQAQAAFKNPVPLQTALRKFVLWYNANAVPDTPIWVKGEHFDVTIMEEIFRRVNGQPDTAPWKYSAPRDVRTIYDVADHWPPTEKNVIPHHALWDAVGQAKGIIQAYNIITSKLDIE